MKRFFLFVSVGLLGVSTGACSSNSAIVKDAADAADAADGPGATDLGDASGLLDSGTPDVIHDHQQWWYPDCTTADGNCRDTCMPISLYVGATLCGAFTKVEGGCTPKGQMTSGEYGCFIRSSDGQVITANVPPSSTDGLAGCGVAVVARMPYCLDGGPVEK
jgi:hypothetical protein